MPATLIVRLQVYHLVCCCRHETDSSQEAGKPGLIRSPPGDAELQDVLQQVQLGGLLLRQMYDRGAALLAPMASNSAAQSRSEADSSSRPPAGRLSTGLDAVADWAGVLSLGEQQRLAFARCAASIHQDVYCKIIQPAERWCVGAWGSHAGSCKSSIRICGKYRTI